MKDPEIPVFDEPTVGIDPDGVMEFRRFVREIIREGRTVFLSTHLLRDLGMVCTHTAILRKAGWLLRAVWRSLKNEEQHRLQLRDPC